MYQRIIIQHGKGSAGKNILLTSSSALMICVVSTVEEKHCPRRAAALAGTLILSMASPIHRRRASPRRCEEAASPLGSDTNQHDQA